VAVKGAKVRTLGTTDLAIAMSTSEGVESGTKSSAVCISP
jgi:hypothetical protein